MKKVIQLSIKNPCSEDFNQFKKTEKGGFCTSCTKEVIDFTGMSSEGIQKYFATSTGNTCGRFQKSQLKTYTTPLTVQEQKKFNFFGAIGLTAIALFFSPAVAGQTNNAMVTTEQTITKNDQTQPPITISGVVYSAFDKFPLPGVSIVLTNSVIGTETDFDGNFKLAGLKAGDVIKVYALGYINQSFTITNVKNLIINLEEDNELFGSIIIAGEVDTKEHYKTKRSFWKRIQSIF